MKNLKTLRALLISLAILGIGFLLCRYALFNFHGMKSFPEFLFKCGLLIIGISALLKARKVMFCTAVGYNIGYVLGLLFNTEWKDVHVTTLTSMWMWFVSVMILFAFAGVVWEIIAAIIRRTTRKTEDGSTS